MKLNLLVELDYDKEMMYGDDPDGKLWFFEDILGGPLTLHSNELGDEVGTVKILSFQTPSEYHY